MSVVEPIESMERAGQPRHRWADPVRASEREATESIGRARLAEILAARETKEDQRLRFQVLIPRFSRLLACRAAIVVETIPPTRHVVALAEMEASMAPHPRASR